MSFEPGECIEANLLPEEAAPPPEEVRDRELHASDLCGRLHRLDPVAVGFAAEPEIRLDAELERWRNAFEACDEDLRAGHEDIFDLLAAKIPATEPTTFIHGDFRLGNTLLEGHRVTSIIDWEISSRSDPRVDLAWFLMMANPDRTLGRRTVPGMPSNEELLARYEATRGERVGSLDWFAALVRYKQAAAGAMIPRNARRRGQDSTAAAGAPALLASARQLLGG
jgi:aminoglycoside phosphotransferase (APT) family kinase protein